MSVCKHCNNEFVKKSYQQEYCCNDCKILASRKRTLEKKHNARYEEFEQHRISKCPVCEREFERVFSPTWRQQKYCSATCRKRVEVLNGSKKITDNFYKDKTRFNGNKHNVLIRDNFECQFCKAKKHLVIHHLDGSGQSDDVNNEMDNLVTLCKSCHAKLHSYINKFNKSNSTR
jgi:5-methylcytosine-specific restriction endonuclease McrA